MPLTKTEADRLVDTIRSFVQTGQTAQAAATETVDKQLAKQQKKCDHEFADSERCVKCGWLPPAAAAPFQPIEGATGGAVLSEQNVERLYQQFKARLLEELQVDTVFLKLLASRPEVEIMIEPRELKLDGTSLRGRIGLLIARGVIKKNADVQRAEIVNELTATGTAPAGNRLAEALASLVVDGILVRDGNGGYRVAPGAKVRETVISNHA